MPSPWFISFALVWAVPAQAEDLAAPTDQAAEDRAFHHGTELGSLGHPRRLEDLAAVTQLCGALQRPPVRDDQNAYQRGVEKAARAEAQRQARRQIFQVDFPATGFRLGDYEVKSAELPLALDKPLVALEGGLTFTPSDRSGGRFLLKAAEAEDVAKRHQAKNLRLRVTFTLQDDRHEQDGGCFGHPKAEAFALLGYPLAYELLQSEAEVPIARSRTPRLERFRAWLDPGAARVKIEVARQSGTVDPELLRATVEAKRSELEACLAPVTAASTATGMASVQLSALPSGAFGEAELELDAYEDPQVASCLQAVLLGLSVKKAPKASRFQVVVSVERG